MSVRVSPTKEQWNQQDKLTPSTPPQSTRKHFQEDTMAEETRGVEMSSVPKISSNELKSDDVEKGHASNEKKAFTDGDVDDGEDNDIESLIESNYAAAYYLWHGLTTLTLVTTVLYCCALCTNQFTVTPTGCDLPSGASWPAATSNFFDTNLNTQYTEGINAQVAWYYDAWSFPIFGGFMCPMSDDTPANTDVCLSSDAHTSLDIMFSALNIRDTYASYSVYRKTWEHFVPLVVLLALISMIYPLTLDILHNPPNKRVPDAWFAAFKPVKNHFAFDKNVVWKNHRSVYMNVVIQFLFSLINLLFISLSMGSYKSIGDSLNSAASNSTTGLVSIFGMFTNDAMNSVPYCTGVDFTYTVWGLYVTSLLLCLVSLAIETKYLFHFYIKTHNGGIFHHLYHGGAWQVIQEST